MTIPNMVNFARNTVSDMVRSMLPKHGQPPTMSAEDQRLAIHLRGNKDLFESLRETILSRIAGRAGIPEPSDPLIAKSMIARDRELQWLLGKLESVYASPVMDTEPTDEEQPA